MLSDGGCDLWICSFQLLSVNIENTGGPPPARAFLFVVRKRGTHNLRLTQERPRSFRAGSPEAASVNLLKFSEPLQLADSGWSRDHFRRTCQLQGACTRIRHSCNMQIVYRLFGELNHERDSTPRSLRRYLYCFPALGLILTQNADVGDGGCIDLSGAGDGRSGNLLSRSPHSFLFQDTRIDSPRCGLDYRLTEGRLCRLPPLPT